MRAPLIFRRRRVSRGTPRGFTFVEILVAMVVFSILTALAVARFRAMKERGYLAEMKTDLGNLRIAEEAYWADHGQYTINQALLDYRTGSRVTVTLTTTDPFAGFDAEAIHVSAPGVICKMYVGRAAAATPSGEVKCK
ncbi:MAG: prepilin-type N-terminal cleavage/methylation domain-containing protein [Gemmatimonadetes bacterium]|nr:prepilin-type N-terminal cleavage/methylation domain-containing protein [Gemmatimonadota bacterium]MBK6457200.1 prepilin-type N-terminal cleavage/methylation domain-containing protein [Gemmatimonadota bacterium]MBK6842409.1 prepilin-type N-terminal cleavage/methylation domain-containing protein [Gemmatimonadota bacterium]MBK8649485.1 prepilin-type N-terminal cleavage/methylation domain-containing protein [Gemmatimonadota bacterium]MBK9978317.1 prepilin-type N-terminal cleavage/methylation do